jgi:hypothetical protein
MKGREVLKRVQMSVAAQTPVRIGGGCMGELMKRNACRPVDETKPDSAVLQRTPATD